MSKKRFDGPAGRIVPMKPTGEGHKPDMDERLQLPATLAEVIKISEAVARDVIDQVFKSSLASLTDLSVAQTLHINALTKVLIDAGLTTQEGYMKILEEMTDEYNRQRREVMSKVNEDENNEGEVSEDDHQDIPGDAGVSAETAKNDL